MEKKSIREGVGQLSHPAKERLGVHPLHIKLGPWGLFLHKTLTDKGFKSY